MELALITVKQVVVLFILIFAGFVCVKTKAVKMEGKKALYELITIFGFTLISDCTGNGYQFVYDGI